MPKVKCTLPNAANEINGVKFVSHASGGMVSEEISEEQAANFAAIPGYALFDAKAASNSGAPALTEEDVAKLRARAEELKVPNAKQLGVKRLQDEVAAAEKAAAEAAAGAQK